MEQGAGVSESPKVTEGQGAAIIALTQEQLKEIYVEAAKVGAAYAIATYNGEKKSDQKKRMDKRLRNTKLLLRNYRSLKEHAENAVYEVDSEESATDILESMMRSYDGGNEEVIVGSIRRSATRTAIIIAHIDAMLDVYESCCAKAANPELEMRRCETVRMMYTGDVEYTVDEIVSLQNVSRETVYKDLKKATNALSALFFGVDGLELG